MVSIIYDPGRFESDAIQCMLERLEVVLHSMLENPEERIGWMGALG